jgi:nucleoid-associated protein YgaU
MMIHKTVLLLIVMIVGIMPAFAQSGGAGLPEPVFAEPPGQVEESNPALGLWFSDFNDVVYYLWDYGSENLPEPVAFLPSASLAAAASSDAEPVIPQNIRNNRYFVESVRLTNLAQESFEYGDYDASTNYAVEALRYAQLSDEYVSLQLKIKEANDAIAAAKSRLDWAAANGVPGGYPREYGDARTYYNDSLSARSAQNWDDAIDAAGKVINALAYVQAVPPVQPVQEPPLSGETPLPAQYTVRTWAVSKDCLWNIAGRPWAYGDPSKWRLLYSANRAKMPQPDNPDLIHPGMILDIPSIRGETRQGMWDSGKTYSPLP